VRRGRWSAWSISERLVAAGRGDNRRLGFRFAHREGERGREREEKPRGPTMADLRATMTPSCGPSPWTPPSGAWWFSIFGACVAWARVWWRREMWR
jgi:hypothetical protein